MAEYNERVAKFWSAMQSALSEVIYNEHVTHDEYGRAMLWIRELIDAREAPMFCDNFFENVVERSTYAGLPGSEGTVQGPYYKANAPMLTEKPFVMPMRPDEPGEPMVLRGQVLDLNGKPIPGALIDLWHSSNDGTYSSFVGDVPPMNLRARFHADDEGRYTVRTIRPAPYQIPHGGPVGQFLEMIGRHAWRPAHFHLKVSAEGYQQLTTQVYFRGGKWLNDGDGDVSSAVKESLVLDVVDDHDQATAAQYDLSVPFHSTDYTVVLRRARD
jgi:catechol 1,2-dioxygenase